jgi:hypothetical protein
VPPQRTVPVRAAQPLPPAADHQAPRRDPSPPAHRVPPASPPSSTSGMTRRWPCREQRCRAEVTARCRSGRRLVPRPVPHRPAALTVAVHRQMPRGARYASGHRRRAVAHRPGHHDQACRLAHSCPLTQTLTGIREVGPDLDEPRAHLLVEDVNIKYRYPALFPGEGELRAPARIGVTLAGCPHQLELLGAADGHHLRAPSRGGGLQVRGHHVGLALPGLKGDHRDAVGLRPVPDIPPELLPDRLEQRRGDDRLASRPRSARSLPMPASGPCSATFGRPA